jgi:replicative DNA helicase
MTATDDRPSPAAAIPQRDLPAEAGVLSSMLVSRDACLDALDALRADHFYDPRNGLVFTLARDLAAAGAPVDATTVRSAAEAAGALRLLGNGTYLLELLESPTTPAAIGHHIGRIKATAGLRRLSEALTRGAQMAAAPGADPDGTPAQVADLVVDAATRDTPDQGVSAGDAATGALEHALGLRDGSIEQQGIPTGYADLDRLTFGLHPGQLVLVAGRPAMGKSVVLLDIARHAAVACGKSVLLASLEMSAHEVGQRLLAAQSGVPLTKIREGRTLTDAEILRLVRAQEQLAAARLVVEDATDLSVAGLRAKATRIARRDGLDLIAVDYLQLMAPPDPRAQMVHQIGAISRGLKVLAKQLRVPLVSACQLNRGPEARPDKTPQLSDLRDSGSLEQDSDVVVMIHRESYYDKDSPRAGEVDLLIRKQRSGPTGTVVLADQLHCARLTNLYPA